MNTLLCTGGTGTIGSAIIPRAFEFWNSVKIYSRDEYKQSLLASLHKGKPIEFILGDIRDEDRLKEAMKDVTHVIHAAALKRIEACEENPYEAINTNIIGTINVLKAATDRALHVTVVSTDKAVNPISIYGATKLTAERLTVAVRSRTTTFGVVRQGNIFGSRGSVVEIWNRHRNENRPVIMTDPMATRYFVTEKEAAGFIVGHTKERIQGIKFPKDLRAYRLCDLAVAMNVNPVIIGIRRLEKIHEEMKEGMSSETAPKLSVEELRKELVTHFRQTLT